jgi:hypothetical protein
MEPTQRYVLRLDEYVKTEHALAVRDARSHNDTVHLRVDWNGFSDNLGTFEVQNLDSQWEAVGNLSPASPLKDLIAARPRPASNPFVIQIRRGPAHGTIPFQAWARRITWTSNPVVLGDLPSDFSAVRESDYIYAETEFPIYESRLEGGVQVVEIPLDLSHHDYELWVKLRHPTDPDRWSIIDPIIGHKDRGGTPGNKHGSRPIRSHSDASV